MFRHLKEQLLVTEVCYGNLNLYKNIIWRNVCPGGLFDVAQLYMFTNLLHYVLVDCVVGKAEGVWVYTPTLAFWCEFLQICSITIVFSWGRVDSLVCQYLNKEQNTFGKHYWLIECISYHKDWNDIRHLRWLLIWYMEGRTVGAGRRGADGLDYGLFLFYKYFLIQYFIINLFFCLIYIFLGLRFHVQASRIWYFAFLFFIKQSKIQFCLVIM